MRNKAISSSLIFISLFLGIGATAFFTSGAKEILIPKVSAQPIATIEPNLEIEDGPKNLERLLAGNAN